MEQTVSTASAAAEAATSTVLKSPDAASSSPRRPFILDMETADPDDFLTLLLLLGHPRVQLLAVTVTPGSREQVGVVKQALAWFGVVDTVPVGSFNIDHPKGCVSDWHYRAFPAANTSANQNNGSALSLSFGELRKQEMECDAPGWKLLNKFFVPGVTLVEGAAPKNLGQLLRHSSLLPIAAAEAVPLAPVGATAAAPMFGRLFFQGGFAGEGVVPPELQLAKFRGRRTCPSFNPGGDRESTLSIIANQAMFEDLRFVSKNVCHGVFYDVRMHALFTAALSHDGGAAAGSHGDLLPRRTLVSQSLIHKGMDSYLSRKRDGKAFHDPLAACCAIDTDIGVWAENVVMYLERGEWGCRRRKTTTATADDDDDDDAGDAAHGRSTTMKIIIDYRHNTLVRTLLPQFSQIADADIAAIMTSAWAADCGQRTMQAGSNPLGRIVLRRTGVFSVFGLAGDGVQ
jgi:hypothetical protein